MACRLWLRRGAVVSLVDMSRQDVPRPAVDVVYPGAVSRLLLGEGRQLRPTSRLLEAYMAALHADGIPVTRCFLSFPTLHPEVRARTFVWRGGGHPVEETHRPWQLGPAFHRSPLSPIFAGTHDVIRRRLCDPGTPRDFEVLQELEASGATDYIALALHVADRHRHPGSISFSCSLPGGFTDEMLQRALASVTLLAPLIDTHLSETIAASLLDVYLGPHAGPRVLRGAVQRGDGETIPAVICFADLRNFTSLADRLPQSDLLGLLNDYFGCVVGAVHAHGGEVLKFIGDAVLAVFRAAPGEEASACEAALTASREAFTAAGVVNDERVAAGKYPMEFGIALHLGEVMYGNIGGPDRLDFTVIGPAVNVTSRIQGLCARLSRRVLVSEAVAQRVEGALEDLGEHDLKGVDVPVRIFSPGMGPL